MAKQRRAENQQYVVGNMPTLKLSGIRGRMALVTVSGDRTPMVTIDGDAGGRLAFSLADVDVLRAGPDFGRLTQHHCYIWRAGQSPINIGGRRDLVLHLASELLRMGRGDRVQRGLPLWMGLMHPLLFCGLGLILVYAPYDTWLTSGDRWTAEHWVTAGLTMALGLALCGWGLLGWLRHYRPRSIRDLDDLAQALPQPKG